MPRNRGFTPCAESLDDRISLSSLLSAKLAALGKPHAIVVRDRTPPSGGFLLPPQGIFQHVYRPYIYTANGGLIVADPVSAQDPTAWQSHQANLDPMSATFGFACPCPTIPTDPIP